jgi:hypothetical protein
MAKTAFTTLFAISAFIIGSTRAFWEYGHLFVARVAYDQL